MFLDVLVALKDWPMEEWIFGIRVAGVTKGGMGGMGWMGWKCWLKGCRRW